MSIGKWLPRPDPRKGVETARYVPGAPLDDIITLVRKADSSYPEDSGWSATEVRLSLASARSYRQLRDEFGPLALQVHGQAPILPEESR